MPLRLAILTLFVAFMNSVTFSNASAADLQLIPIRNAGFEGSGVDAVPSDWRFDGAIPSAPAEARLDAQVRREGTTSFMVKQPEAGSLTLVSAPVQLAVGKLYRLSGWIRTEKASSDPPGRYPTPVAATLSMASFPFTNSAPSVAGSSDWKKVEVMFFATRASDNVRVHFGFNGTATGTAWFDDLRLERVEDITQYIPMETVRWSGPGFRYTDQGWIFVHIEGEPYARGVQYGSLLAKEITSYIEKLAVRENADNPRQGWEQVRTLTDALFLRKYEEEYLVEMRGIAVGAAKEGAVLFGRPVDFLDIVTMNSSVDLGQLGGALAKTATPLSGRSFHAVEEEMAAPERLHKCSSFLANGSATPDGDIVFGQLFMWNGYTGVHWNVICDVVPSRGHRLVYETFPGGIHSGADFYINDAGIMLGETTVMQTPFNAEGTPQSSRIRKAAQYAESIDDVERILTEKNNGLYTNDWLIGDAKSNETAILLLGTNTSRLWRSGKKDFPGGTTDFYWSVNNAKDPEVRKEYIPDPTNAPFDLAFNSVNRDVAFVDFYKKQRGRIDATAAYHALATSPINRPHACDGKVTTTEMARHLMLYAHFGKVTLREKFPEKNGRLIQDLPNAVPHLTLGYTAFSPVFVAEKLKESRGKETVLSSPSAGDLSAVEAVYAFGKPLLWHNTVYPATDAENWFVSGSAAYWRMLDNLAADKRPAMEAFRDQLADMNARLLYTMSHEGALAPVKARRDYSGFKNYLIPRIRGTFLLHQLRMMMGNKAFSALMKTVHARFMNAPMSTAQFVSLAEESGAKGIVPVIRQWIERDDVPNPVPRAQVENRGGSWVVRLTVDQAGRPYAFMTTVAIETSRDTRWEVVRIDSGRQTVEIASKNEPRKIVFNAGSDIPVPKKNFYTYANFFDDFDETVVVYGTSRQVEAHHTLALRYQTVVADQFTESLPPVVQDCEVERQDLVDHDLILLGGAADNALVKQISDTLGLELSRNAFSWGGKTYGSAEDGIFLVYPNPYNPRKIVFLIVANSALQLYQMTKRYQPVGSWAVFKGDQAAERGYHPGDGMEIDLHPGKGGGLQSRM